ncbi:PaaI family thioesterase [Oceanicola sp. 22II-s10i]|uniref:PaaI family thioesterase n=1 Tax=Oceanicola sp. 22II-s10i TaxID=1317116 RepID=UPI000B522F1F|nr:PaaI family thioesterase [Oceanicola sp. 22II-s10i]
MNTQHDPKPNFGTLVGMKRLESGSGTCVLELSLRPEHCNINGTVHGGVLATMLDTAGMWAGGPDGQPTPGATVSMTCNYISAVPFGKFDRLVAHARLTKKGRRLYFSDIHILAEPGEKLVANGQAICAVAAERTETSTPA